MSSPGLVKYFRVRNRHIFSHRPKGDRAMAPNRKLLSGTACVALIGLAFMVDSPVAVAQEGMRSPAIFASWRDHDRFESEGTPIDGLWVLSADGRRISIRDGGSYNEKTGQPLSRNIHETRPGTFVLHEFDCNCRATMKLTLDGALLGVSHTLIGPVRWTLHPLSLDHPGWFQHELHRVEDED